MHASIGEFDWVIVSGESGAGARPINQDWIADLRRQCETAGVAFTPVTYSSIRHAACAR